MIEVGDERTIDLDKIAAAMSAYPFEGGMFVSWTLPPQSCAVGQMLRYAGVDAGELRKLNGNMGAPWMIYNEILRREYGLPDEIAYWTIVYASDGTMPEDDAVANVRNALSGGPLDGIMDAYAGMIAAGRKWRQLEREKAAREAALTRARADEDAAAVVK